MVSNLFFYKNTEFRFETQISLVGYYGLVRERMLENVVKTIFHGMATQLQKEVEHLSWKTREGDFFSTHMKADPKIQEKQELLRRSLDRLKNASKRLMEV